MANAFLIRADTGWERLKAPELDGVHVASVPGITCPCCGSWALSGIEYPTIDTEGVRRAVGVLEPWPIALEAYTALKSRIEHFFGTGQEIVPGAKLGPIIGNACGELGDFAWLTPWTILLRESVAKQLKDAGFGLTCVNAELDFGGDDDSVESYQEIEVLPIVHLAPSLVPIACAICHRLPISAPKRIVLSAKTYDSELPIQRIYELPTYVVVNKRFAEFVTANKMTNVLLEPVEVQD
jgi:uncharacterized double-CXXCG motif protein